MSKQHSTAAAINIPFGTKTYSTQDTKKIIIHVDVVTKTEVQKQEIANSNNTMNIAQFH